MDNRNKHSIVNQLYSNKNNLKIIIFWENKTPTMVHQKKQNHLPNPSSATYQLYDSD